MGATYRLLLDENLEHKVRDRLVDAGHDVEHVDTVAALGKGVNDTDLAAYPCDTNSAIVTTTISSRTFRPDGERRLVTSIL